MLSETLTNLIGTLSKQYSYVSRTKKFKRGEGDESKYYTQEQAIEDILYRLAVNHSTEYAPYSEEKDSIKQVITDNIVSAATSKKKIQTSKVVANTNAATYSTGLDSKIIENPLWKPEKPFNIIDCDWCSGLVTDDNNILYHKKANGSYELIGSINGKVDENIVARLERTQPIPDVDQFIKDRLGILTAFAAKTQEYEAAASGESGDASKLAVNKILSELITVGYDDVKQIPIKQDMKSYLGISDEDKPKTLDGVISKLVYKFLNSRLPASIFCGLLKLMKYYNMWEEEGDDKPKASFQGFVFKSGNDTSPTKRKYFRNVLENYPEYLGHIDSRPKAVSMDGTEPAFGVFNQKLWDEDVKKYGNLDYEDSLVVKTVLDPMDDDQKLFLTAWVYAMFFNIGVVISLLQMDNGGTLKSTLKQIVRRMVVEYFGADINFVMKRDQLCHEQYLFDGNRKLSIADALFVDYDEPTVKGELWEKVKAFTGGVTVDFAVKELYHNPYVVSGSPLFWFGSNKPIYLQDKGAYERRLATIKTKAHNTWKNIPSNMLKAVNTDIELQKKEFHLLMKMGKQAYEEINSKYGTLAEAAVSMPSMAAELDSQSPWDEYLCGFYNSLFEGQYSDYAFRKIPNDELDELFEEYLVRKRTKLSFEQYHWRNYCRDANPNNEVGKKMYYKKTKQTVRGGIYYKNEPEEITDEYIALDDEIDEMMNSNKDVDNDDDIGVPF